MKEAQRLGLIDKIPGGWRKGTPRKPANIIAKAREILAMAKSELVVGESALAAQLERAVGKGIDAVVLFLDAADGGEFEKLGKKAEIGLQLIRAQQRLDDTKLRAQNDDRFISMLEDLSEAKQRPVPTLEGPEKSKK